MIDFEQTLYEIWWVSDTDDEDSDPVYTDLWSLDFAKEKLNGIELSEFDAGGHYCIVKVVSRYEEI